MISRARQRTTWDRMRLLGAQYGGGFLGVWARYPCFWPIGLVVTLAGRAGDDGTLAAIAILAQIVLAPLLVPLGVHMAARRTGSRGSIGMATLGTVLYVLLSHLVAMLARRMGLAPWRVGILYSFLGAPILPVLGYNLPAWLRRNHHTEVMQAGDSSQQTKGDG